MADSLAAPLDALAPAAWATLRRSTGLLVLPSLVALVTGFWPTYNPFQESLPDSGVARYALFAGAALPLVGSWWTAMLLSRRTLRAALPRPVAVAAGWPLRVLATAGALGPVALYAVVMAGANVSFEAYQVFRPAVGIAAAAATLILFMSLAAAMRRAGRRVLSLQIAVLSVAASAAIVAGLFSRHSAFFGFALWFSALKDFPMLGVGYPATLRWVWYWLWSETWIPSWSWPVTSAAIATVWSTVVLAWVWWASRRLARAEKAPAAPSE